MNFHRLDNKTAFSSSKIEFQVHRIALLPLDDLGIGAWHLYSYLVSGLNSKDIKKRRKVIFNNEQGFLYKLPSTHFQDFISAALS